MKYLHLFSWDENNKFLIPYMEFINENFNQKEHDFVVAKDERNHSTYTVQDCVHLQYNVISIVQMFKIFNKYEKIYIHSLSENKYVKFGLALQPWNYKKYYWLIWGADLYNYKIKTSNFKTLIKKKIHGHLIKNMHGLITHLKGDYELAQKWYGAKGKYYYSFLYPSNLYKKYDLKKGQKSPKKKYIQIGNSACETNNHIEVFEKLSKYKSENIEFICPLSYSGKEEYIKEVIDAGYKTFGKEKFNPITDFMSFDKYLELLAKVDVAIFNHKRQRGLGNIITLLGLGKKVYIREEITTWQFCIDHDLKVYNANADFDDLLDKMSEDLKQKNKNKVKRQFSEKKLVEDWKKIFNA